MNASQIILESEKPPRGNEEVSTSEQQPVEHKTLRLLEAPAEDQEPEPDSFKKTANLFGRALSALFR